MSEKKSKQYLLQFTFQGIAYNIPVSEVPLAYGATAFIVKLHYYKGLFVKAGSQWTVKSQGLISGNLKNQIINELVVA